MDRSLSGMRIAILATDGVEEAELAEPRKALDQEGARTTLIGPKEGQIQAFRHHDKGSKFDVDMRLDQAAPNDFDAVLLPGGALNADALRVNEAAQQFVRAMQQTGKPIAVICHAAWLLISANLVKGKNMTSYHTIQDDVRNAGANWADTEVVVDGNWVSSRQPSDIPAFNRQMITLFAEQQTRAKKAA